MTMRLPVDTFVMSAASGDCPAEGGRVLTLLLGGVRVFCVNSVSRLSLGEWGEAHGFTVRARVNQLPKEVQWIRLDWTP